MPIFQTAIVKKEQGGGAVTSKDVDFIDYNGTLVASYTAEEFANLAALPANPTHEGLTAQGWNWSLSDAKTYVASYGKLIIGQMYTTSSGATEIDIELHEGRLAPYCGFAVNGTVTIDWGDSSTPDVVTGTSTSTVKSTQHTYASAGSYTIKLTPSSGTTYALAGTNSYGSQVLWKNTSLGENIVYQSAIHSIRVGSGCSINDYGLYYCSSLTLVTIPNNVTSISNFAFQNCYSLASVTIPIRVNRIGRSGFFGCTSLSSVTIPNSVTTIDSYGFGRCRSLLSIIIPSGVRSIGYSTFADCDTLSSIVMPIGVNSIEDYTFNNCYSLSSVTIPSGVTSIGSDAFSYCWSLSSITIPSSVTSIGSYAFTSCSNISSVTIPSGVTSISNQTFNGCLALSSITIPSSVTSIGSYAFQDCAGLSEIHFKGSTPPTVSNSNAWYRFATDCKIYVPTGSLSAYKSATNYPSSSTYTYIEE